MITCYKNIALAGIKMKQFKLAIIACNEALSINPNNSKALYIRAKARITPMSSGVLDMKEAIDDLEIALKVAPDDLVIL